MRIVNETPFSINLIKRLMRAACVKAEPGKSVRIVQDRRFKSHLGLFTGHDGGYVIRLRDLGDTITLGHELRHLAQYQRGLFSEWTENQRELDAEGFESWLEGSGVF